MELSGQPDIKNIIEPENKLTMIVFRDRTNHEMFGQFSGLSTIYLLDENTATVHFSFYFPRNSVLSRIFMKKIDQLITGGLIQKSEADRKVARNFVKNDDPQQLTINHLGVCFLAILISLGLSGVVFLAEFMFWFLTKRFAA